MIAKDIEDKKGKRMSDYVISSMTWSICLFFLYLFTTLRTLCQKEVYKYQNEDWKKGKTRDDEGLWDVL